VNGGRLGSLYLLVDVSKAIVPSQKIAIDGWYIQYTIKIWVAHYCPLITSISVLNQKSIVMSKMEHCFQITNQPKGISTATLGIKPPRVPYRYPSTKGRHQRLRSESQRRSARFVDPWYLTPSPRAPDRNTPAGCLLGPLGSEASTW